MVFCEALSASPAEFDMARRTLAHQFAPRPDIATHVSDALLGFTVVLRGTRLYLETPQAAAQLAFAYLDSSQRWCIAIDNQGEALNRHLKLPAPAVKTTQAKSQDGAIKALLRLAHKHFGFELQAT